MNLLHYKLFSTKFFTFILSQSVTQQQQLLLPATSHSAGLVLPAVTHILKGMNKCRTGWHLLKARRFWINKGAVTSQRSCHPALWVQGPKCLLLTAIWLHFIAAFKDSKTDCSEGPQKAEAAWKECCSAVLLFCLVITTIEQFWRSLKHLRSWKSFIFS